MALQDTDVLAVNRDGGLYQTTVADLKTAVSGGSGGFRGLGAYGMSESPVTQIRVTGEGAAAIGDLSPENSSGVAGWMVSTSSSYGVLWGDRNGSPALMGFGGFGTLRANVYNNQSSSAGLCITLINFGAYNIGAAATILLQVGQGIGEIRGGVFVGAASFARTDNAVTHELSRLSDMLFMPGASSNGSYTAININNFPSLSDVTTCRFALEDIQYRGCTFTLTGNALSQASVDKVLTDLAAGAIQQVSSCYIRLEGGTNSAPSAAGIAARDALVAKGWAVTTN
jgi:hypothetical protein